MIHRAVGGTDQDTGDLLRVGGDGGEPSWSACWSSRVRATGPGRGRWYSVGPFEHHSNLLPWRESAAEVVAVGEDANGQLDLAELEDQLARHAGRPLVVGSFSAAVQRHRHPHRCRPGRRPAPPPRRAVGLGLRSAAAPYVPIRHGRAAPGPATYKDAVFFSPHKLVGGPETPGVLVVRWGWLRNRVPTVSRAAAPSPVDPVGHRYLDDPVGREEGGTPGIIESIRAGLVFQLKQAVGTDLIQAREQRFLRGP